MSIYKIDKISFWVGEVSEKKLVSVSVSETCVFVGPGYKYRTNLPPSVAKCWQWPLSPANSFGRWSHPATVFYLRSISDESKFSKYNIYI